MSESKKLEGIIFVWNAEMNLKGACIAVADFLRQEHSCSLCEIAYHTVALKRDWKTYKAELRIPFQGLYKNQLSPEQRDCVAEEFPAVLARIENKYVRLLGKSEIDACQGNLDMFKTALDAQLGRYAV